MFQREFVWDKEQSAKLIDFILKGFPIGTFIFWRTRDELRSYKEVGNHRLPETPKGDYVQYILDGQQRITSLYAIRKGIRLTKDGKEVDYKDIFINLDYEQKEDEQIVVTERLPEKHYVSVHDVLSKPLGTFYKTLSHELADLVEAYKNRLTSHDFSTITIKDYPIEVACEVFSRINTGGKALTVFEIMVAKTYDEAKGFDLAERYGALRDGSDEDRESLTAAKFETIPEAIVMQCVAAITLRAVRSRDILKIRRDTFIEKWEPMKASLFTAVDFIRSELRVPAGFPSPAQDEIAGRIDLNRDLVKHPLATNYVRVEGDSMEPCIHAGEPLVVDRMAETKDGEVVGARVVEEFTVKRLHTEEGGRIWLASDNTT